MWKDPIVEEVRGHREAHAAKFNYDLAAICRDLRRQQANSDRKIVSLPAKRVQLTVKGVKGVKSAIRFSEKG